MQHLNDNELSIKHIKSALMLADVVYELQRERGLSMLVTANNRQELRTTLDKQQEKTDQIIKNILPHINTGKTSPPRFKKEHELKISHPKFETTYELQAQLKNKIKQIPEIRKDLSLDNQDRVFDYYTEVNNKRLWRQPQ